VEPEELTDMKYLPLKFASLAGLLGAAFSGSFSHAQEYAPPAAYGPREELQVIAPRFHREGTRLNGLPEKVSLSTEVRYDDLNLLSRRGAYELRRRVSAAAWETCTRLAQAYPVYTLNGTSCYKTALENALLRADEAIDDARTSYRMYRD
jgi:UrcA family protein